MNAYVVKPVDFNEFVRAIGMLGLFWAIINEPPPANMKSGLWIEYRSTTSNVQSTICELCATAGGEEIMKEKLQILNLEDNPTDSDLIRETLEDGGIECEITRVETGEDFLAACDKGGFDIILTDYSLPSYDGFSALTVARERRPDLPFIFVSGKMGEDIAVESLKNGATDYILNPTTIFSLI